MEGESFGKARSNANSRPPLERLFVFVEWLHTDPCPPSCSQSMVSLPPPWTPDDLFKVVQQHWFSLDLDKDTQSCVDLARHLRERKQDKGEVSRIPLCNVICCPADFCFSPPPQSPKQGYLALLDGMTRLFETSIFSTEKSNGKFDQERSDLRRLRDAVYNTGAQTMAQ